MEKVIRFEPLHKTKSATLSEVSEVKGHIIMFTGVQYSWHDDAPSQDDNHQKPRFPGRKKRNTRD